MKTFFSIIYIPLRPDFQEKISVGLVMSNDEKTIFKISNSKLQVLRNLIPSKKYNLLKNYFNNIERELNPNSKNLELNISSHENLNSWVNESYFSYLNRYSNNLVIYSDPRRIDLKIDNENFKLIFEKLIFNYLEESEIKKTADILTRVKTKLYSKIQDRVNLNVTVKTSDFNELITPVDVNFIGKNGVIVAGQTLDFKKRLYNLEHDLTSFISFTKAVDFSTSKNGKYFLVGEEPNKKEHPKNHKTWKHVRESHLVEYVDFKETEKVKQYIFEKDVLPFYDKEIN